MILQQDIPLLAQNPIGGGLRALERRVEELRDHANALCRDRENGGKYVENPCLGRS
ncbi:hypothetical protein Hdeb2414_s0003g00109381 [Helianthus debilis subsp. tardiflorus]